MFFQLLCTGYKVQAGRVHPGKRSGTFFAGRLQHSSTQDDVVQFLISLATVLIVIALSFLEVSKMTALEFNCQLGVSAVPLNSPNRIC